MSLEKSIDKFAKTSRDAMDAISAHAVESINKIGLIIEAQATRITELEALCLNALYHHQGASSAVGQPIRKALGMGEFDRITEAQLKIIHSVRAPYAAIAEGKA